MSMISISCGITTTSTNLPMQTRWTSLLSRLTAKKEILAEQFTKYTNHQPAIYTIPVGSLASLPQNENRTPFSMITASRLATEKHIDWLVRAVVRAKRELPELSFDIYGKGGEEGKLRSLIDELGGRLYPSQRACQSRGNL